MQKPLEYFQDKTENVLLLKKCLYGLKQLGREWYKCLLKALQSMGFKKSSSDAAVFYWNTAKEFTIIRVAIDDLTITAANKDILHGVKKDLENIFNMKDLGEIHWLLNLKIDWNKQAGMISISQEAYIDSILERFNLQDAKIYSSPLDPNTKLSKDQCLNMTEDKKKMEKVPYRQAIGSLMWAAVATWPDIAFAVSFLSQFLENPGEIHWNATKRVFKYLKGTKNRKLTLGKSRDGIIGYSDADWASQDHRHSISAYIFQINSGSISWSCQKQLIIALSSTEVKFIAMMHAAKEAIWLHHFIIKVFQPLHLPLQIYSDNQSAITIAYGNQMHARTKHFDIRLYFIRNTIENNKINFEYLPTEHMLADILSKAL